MGKKGGWFSCAFNSPKKSKKYRARKREKHLVPVVSSFEETAFAPPPPPPPSPPPPPLAPPPPPPPPPSLCCSLEDVRLTEPEDDRSMHAYPEAFSTAMIADHHAVSAQNVEHAVSPENDQSAISAENDRPAFYPRNDQSALSDDNDQPPFSPRNDQSALSAENDQLDVFAENGQPAFSAEDYQLAFSSKTCQPAISPKNVQPAVFAENDQLAVFSENDQSAISAENDQPAFSAQNDQPVFSPENDQPAFSLNNDQPAVSPENGHSDVEVVRLTTVACYSGKSREEVAAIRIQTTFRIYSARKAIRALKGRVRLKAWIQGRSVKWQARNALRALQTLAREQSQIRARRTRMSEENQALYRQLQQQKREKPIDKIRAPWDDNMQSNMQLESSTLHKQDAVTRRQRALAYAFSHQIGEQWDDSLLSKEQLEASMLHKQEAARKRERALAYAISLQKCRRNSPKSTNTKVMDENNPQWSSSWLDRWTSARPWDSQSSIKSTMIRAVSNGDDNKLSPGAQKSRRQSPSSPPGKALSLPQMTGKMKPENPRDRRIWGGYGDDDEDDSRSMFSVRSERYRRHSITGSSVRDDESVSSSSSIRSYMIFTESAKAKSRLSSPLGADQNEKPDKAPSPPGYAKKRFSFSASSPGRPRRQLSGPPELNSRAINLIELQTDD